MILVTKETIAFVMVWSLSSHENMLFSRRECINQTYKKAVYETPVLKGDFLCKISTNHKSCKQYPRKVYNKFLLVSDIGFLLLRLIWDFVIRKLFRKRGINIHAACEDFIKFDDCLNQSEIQWRQKKFNLTFQCMQLT